MSFLIMNQEDFDDQFGRDLDLKVRLYPKAGAKNKGSRLEDGGIVGSLDDEGKLGEKIGEKKQENGYLIEETSNGDEAGVKITNFMGSGGSGSDIKVVGECRETLNRSERGKKFKFRWLRNPNKSDYKTDQIQFWPKFEMKPKYKAKSECGNDNGP